MYNVWQSLQQGFEIETTSMDALIKSTQYGLMNILEDTSRFAAINRSMEFRDTRFISKFTGVSYTFIFIAH